MISREELFRETEERIDDVTGKLRSHFFDLGIILFRNPDILPADMGVSLVKAAREAEAALNEAERKKEDDAAFIREYDSRKAQKIEKDEALETLRLKERDIRLRLGALIYEQCSLSLLPRDNFSAVYDDADAEKALNEKMQSASFWKRLRSSSVLKRIKHNDETRYLDYSSFADDEKNAVLITGEKGQALVSELGRIKEARKALREEVVEMEEFLSSSVTRRRSLDKGEKDEDESRVEESRNAFNECIINYGNYLYDRGGSWIGESTPPEVLDAIQLILENQNEYSRLVKRRSQLQKEAKADDYKTMIEEEREKIRILEDEKKRIDLQIDEINREIDRLEGIVEKLVRTQDQK